MIHVKTVDTWYLKGFHRIILYLLNHFTPLRSGECDFGHIQYRAHLVGADNIVKAFAGKLQIGILFRIITSQCHNFQLCHLTNFLLERHLLKHFIDATLHRLISGNDRIYTGNGQSSRQGKSNNKSGNFHK